MKAKRQTKKTVGLANLHRQVKLAVVPHKANQYRPHLVRRYGLAVVAIVIAAMQVGYGFALTGNVLGDTTTITTAGLLDDTNDERSKQDMSPLALNKKLSQAAALKVQDMFDRQYWAHAAPDGTMPWAWVTKAGYEYSYAGENLAKNFRSADAAVAAWMNSPGHRANILNKHYTDVGFAMKNGILAGERATIIVALYGAPVQPDAVAGLAETMSPPVGQSTNLVARLGVAIQALSPSMIGALAVLLIVAFVAVAAHAYRSKLPRGLRESWYRHHGLAKASGALVVCLIILVFYGTGQV